MNNIIRVVIIIVLILQVVLPVSGCGMHDRWIRFAFNDETFYLNKSDVVSVRKTGDAGGGVVVVLVLNDRAKANLSTVTKRHVNSKVDLFLDDLLIRKDIPVVEEVSQAEIHLAVDSPEKADEIVKSWESR